METSWKSGARGRPPRGGAGRAGAAPRGSPLGVRVPWAVRRSRVCQETPRSTRGAPSAAGSGQHSWGAKGCGSPRRGELRARFEQRAPAFRMTR